MANEWVPIVPPSETDFAVDLGDVRPLFESWSALRQRLQTSRSGSLARFRERLIRSHSIETGILERLYDLDRGTTETLVEHGFVEDLIPRSSTNIDPGLLVEILRDHEAAFRFVGEVIRRDHPLTKGQLHELHSLLTRHQPTTTGVDQLGNRREVPLRRGAFKEWPNNPTRPDGTVHQYCPPIHVDQEIDNLLAWFATIQHRDPLVVAAWLHHRFTQVHPYQDGNGRVARGLMNLVLLRAELMPLVIDRDEKHRYLSALEAADAGDLSKLVQLFGVLEKRALLQALSVDFDVEAERDGKLTKAVIAGVSAKVARLAAVRERQLRQVDVVAKALRTAAASFVGQGLAELREALAPVGIPESFVDELGTDDGHGHWYRYEVVDFSREIGKWINFDEPHHFVKSTVRLHHLRLVFVVSFHHLGRELSGVMEATSFGILEDFEGPDQTRPVSRRPFRCSLEPFVLTWNVEARELEEGFRTWLDSGLAVALKEWSDRI